MAADEFIMTIDSEEEGPLPETSSNSRKSKTSGTEDAQLDPEFTFDLSGDPYSDLLDEGADVLNPVHSGSQPVCTVSNHPALRLTR